MRFDHKLFRRTSNSEQGFVLIVALLAIAVLIAIGFFALTMISGDLMISSRLVGERKAFSAAEAGVHAILSSGLDPSAAVSSPTPWTHVDSTNDPNTYYNAVTTATGSSATVPGYDPSSRAVVYSTVVTGKDDTYGSQAQIAIGMSGRPVDSTTIQGKL